MLCEHRVMYFISSHFADIWSRKPLRLPQNKKNEETIFTDLKILDLITTHLRGLRKN